MTVIHQLHYIKAFREKKAESEMVKSRILLARAQAEEEQSRQALEAQRRHARDEELRMYRELCERVVRLREITRVQEDVLGLQARTREHQAQLADAERAHAQARGVFDDSLAHYRTASSAREKFEELMRREDQQMQKDAERREETELEEMSGHQRDRLDFEERDYA